MEDVSVAELMALGQVAVIKPGDLYEDCDVRPCICTIGNVGGDSHVLGIALTDGQEVFCSSVACGLRLITPDEIRPLRDAWFTRQSQAKASER